METPGQSYNGLSLTDSEESKTSWRDVLLNDIVFDCLCSFLEFPDIHSLRKTSKEFAGPYQRVLRIQWSLTSRLNRFVKNATGLRERLGIHNAVISGSFALQLFARVFWEEADMDIFMQEKADFDAFGEYLCSEEGYKLESVNTDTEGHYFTKASQMHQVATYSRSKHDERAGQINEHTDSNKTVIQLIQTIRHPVEAILLDFYTTTVLNFITWNKAYSLFPESVINCKTYLLARVPDFQLRRTGDIYAEPLAKYRNRGWDTQECVSDEDLPKVRSMQLGRTRRVGDSHTWKMVFSTDGIKKPSVPDSVIDETQFDIREKLFPDRTRVINRPLMRAVLGRVEPFRFSHYEITTPGYLRDFEDD